MPFAMPLSNGGGFCLGIGLSSGAEGAGLFFLAEQAIERSGRALGAMRCLATISTRQNHPAVLELQGRFGVPIVSFDVVRLEAETPRLKNPSRLLFARIGCHGVAEAAALAAAGVDAVLIVEKMAGPQVTVAIAGMPEIS